MMTEKERSEAGRMLALARKQVEHTCPVCGKVFLARNPRAVYCSPRCLMQKRRADAKAKKGEHREDAAGDAAH